MLSLQEPGLNFKDVSHDPAYYSDLPLATAMDGYLIHTYNALERTRRGAMLVRKETDPLVLFSSGESQGAFRATGMYDNRHHHAMPTIVGIMDSAVLQANAGGNYSILTINHPLNKTSDTQLAQYLKSGTDLTVAINIIIALSFVPASFVLFLVGERMSKAKHLQFVSGVTPSIYWLSTFAWYALGESGRALYMYMYICICIYVYMYAGR